MSSGEIDITKYTHVDGVKIPDAGLPEWKATMVQDKNLKLIKKYLEEQAEKVREEERWRSVPGWKKELMLKQEQKKQQIQGEQKAKLEAELKEKEKFNKLPEWKKQIILKKKVDDSQSVGSSKGSDISESMEEIPAVQTNGIHEKEIILTERDNSEPVQSEPTESASDEGGEEGGDNNKTPELDDVLM